MSYLYVAALEFEVFIFFFWNKFKVVKGWQIIKGGGRRKTNISKFKCDVCIYPAPKERGCSVLPLCCYLSVIKISVVIFSATVHHCRCLKIQHTLFYAFHMVGFIYIPIGYQLPVKCRLCLFRIFTS